MTYRARAFHCYTNMPDKSLPRINRMMYFNDRATTDLVVIATDDSFYLHRRILINIEFFHAIMLRHPTRDAIDINLPSKYLRPALEFFYGGALPTMTLREMIELFEATDFLFADEPYSTCLLNRITALRAYPNSAQDIADSLKLVVDHDTRFEVYDTDITYAVLELIPLRYMKRVMLRVPREYKIWAVFYWVVAHHETKTYHPDDARELLELCTIGTHYDSSELLKYYNVFMSYNTVTDLRNFITDTIVKIKSTYPTAGNIPTSITEDGTYPSKLYELIDPESPARYLTPYNKNEAPIIVKEPCRVKSDPLNDLTDRVKRLRC